MLFRSEMESAKMMVDVLPVVVFSGDPLDVTFAPVKVVVECFDIEILKFLDILRLRVVERCLEVGSESGVIEEVVAEGRHDCGHL